MPAEGRSIALVGQVNRDTIFTPDGVQTESTGGLLYSMLSLAEIAEATIYPICNVGQDMEAVVREQLAAYPAVRLDGIWFVPDRNPHCFLDYDASGQKQETLKGGVPKLTFDRMRPFLGCEAICFNFITGLELSLETLQEVRRATDGLILMDVHSLTLGIDEERRRFWRVPPQWESWLGCADVVQLNEQEGALLAGEALAEDVATLRFAEQVLSLGPTALLVTRNERGSQTIFRNGKGVVKIGTYGASPAGPPQDETGCGDVFLMGFAWAYLQTADLDRASRFANRVAGINCCLRGIDEIGQIGRFLGPEDRFAPSGISRRE
jgi:sugar/nucleoside kinase (ribokinase family)